MIDFLNNIIKEGGLDTSDGPHPPGPLKCFNAPSQQILAKSAPQKARNRDKAEFATKVHRSS